ncbi:MAG: stage III sporulation protein AD [Clostridiales bacterium]|nr:stage III sporulation protein AD [Clostridiales bacterium]
MTMVAVGIVGIAAVLLAVSLKSVNGEYGTYLALAASCFIALYGTSRLKSVMDALRQLQEWIQVNPVYLKTLIKMTGMTYIAEFSAGICRDAGYGAIGSQIEIFGKLSILAVSTPILLALMETLQRFLI